MTRLGNDFILSKDDIAKATGFETKHTCDLPKVDDASQHVGTIWRCPNCKQHWIIKKSRKSSYVARHAQQFRDSYEWNQLSKRQAKKIFKATQKALSRAEKGKKPDDQPS